MPLKAIGRAMQTSLKLRVMLLTLAAFAAVAVPAYISFDRIVHATVMKLGTLFAEKQILFDRYRGMEALMREVSLTEILMRDPAVIAWAQDEFSFEKHTRGIAALEHFRQSFSDKSYFLVINGSGNYYYNDADNNYRANQLRYTIQPDNPRDGWYYKTIAMGAGCHLNVDHDDNLLVTKVWINCVLEKAGQPLGIIGTGVDLSTFIREVVALPQSGVQSIFVDKSGAVQAHRDARYVDFHSLTKDLKEKKTIFAFIDEEADRAALAEMMREVADGGFSVRSRFMSVSGTDTLVGVGYLDRLGWYNITLMDVNRIIGRELFLPIALLLICGMVGAAGVITWLFKRSVLDRLARLEASTRSLEQGDFARIVEDPDRDEIGRLSQAFSRMANTVQDNQRMLENMVRERTEKLEHLAFFDTMTGLLNRRGLIDAFARERNRASRAEQSLGLLLVDVDRFKLINDTMGHHAGDQVLTEVAARLKARLRSYDLSARWGGDEFLVLINGCDEATLGSIGRKIVSAVRNDFVLVDGTTPVSASVSVGGYVTDGEEDLETSVSRADLALYAAKASGRDRFMAFDGRMRGAGTMAGAIASENKA